MTERSADEAINRERPMELLSENRDREYQAVIVYVTYGQVLKGLSRHEHSRGRVTHAAGLRWIYKEDVMIRKLKSGEYRLYSKKTNPKTNKRRNLGTFTTREAAEKHERDVQYFKRH